MENYLSDFSIDVVKTARQIFHFPHSSDILFTQLDLNYVEKMMKSMMIEGTSLTPTLKRNSFLPKYKIMINIIHRCFLGLLESWDQVSQQQ